MFRLIVLTLAVASLAFATTEENILANVQVVNNIEQFKLDNPDAILTPLTKLHTGRERLRITYTLGNRISGDRLVAQGSNSQSYPSAQDIRLTLQYPTSGTGAIITFIRVTVDQSTNQGQGYVVSGGIGQRSIIIVVEAYSTVYFNYVAEIYGY